MVLFMFPWVRMSKKRSTKVKSSVVILEENRRKMKKKREGSRAKRDNSMSLSDLLHEYEVVMGKKWGHYN